MGRGAWGVGRAVICYDVRVTTLQITLDDDVYARLAARASRRSLTVEQMLEQAAVAEAAVQAPDPAASAREHMARYPRTFERLSQ